MIDFPSVLYLLRKEKGWTQRQLADRAGIAYANLHRYENGVNDPSISIAQYLLEAMGYGLKVVTIDEINTDTGSASGDAVLCACCDDGNPKR